MENKDLILSNGKRISSGILDGFKTKKTAASLINLPHVDTVDKVVVILTDGSGSMAEGMDNGIAKIDVAWNLFKNELAPNLAGWTYGVIIFEDRVYWKILPTASPNAIAISGTPAADGSTSLFGALILAWDWVRKHAKQARFILLSDGVPTDLPPSEIIKIAKDNKDIPIDTVGIGSKKDTMAFFGSFGSYNPEFLRMLAEVTGGKFYEVGNAKLLAQAVHELAPAQRPLLGTVKPLLKNKN